MHGQNMVKRHEQFNCPLCDKLIGPWSRGITFHAKDHGLTLPEFWLTVNRLESQPTCQCSDNCKKLTSWHSWSRGFLSHATGHYDVNKKKEITRERLLSDKHWSRGKTKDTDDRLRLLGQKMSVTLKKKFSDESFKHWSKGKTKETHPSLASISKKMMGRQCHFNSIDVVMKAILDKTSDKFTLLTPVDEIENRQNNKALIDIKCNNFACEKITTLTIYNLTRKQRQRCRHCNVPKRWISNGERELVSVLRSMYKTVEHTVYVNGWSIDVYVPYVSVYFQFDGVYWHGLDRPVSEITNKKILKKVERDRRQVEWFSENSLNLVRITDVEWENAADKVTFLLERMKSK